MKMEIIHSQAIAAISTTIDPQNRRIFPSKLEDS